ncbi:MAG TPA: DNA-processing protein DprA, partial [Acidimicrobiales bacterium]|nr:DNA-processing protein DprA [Acidimicrobiales bacterium]
WSPAAPVGVAASGVDVPYPRQHAALWERVCEMGAVLSETPPGQPAQAWRFPTRNRIIAGLSLMVVVVESHSGGGSLITAEAALERGVEVRAVPGPVRSPASAGSNQLLYDGPGPVRSAQDVLDALGVFLPGSDDRDGPGARGLAGGRGRSAGGRGRGGADEQLNSSERAVLEAVAWRPASVGQVVERSGLAVGTVAMVLDQLEARGLIGREGGWWVRVSARVFRGP